jgi:ribosomal protein L30/L7E
MNRRKQPARLRVTMTGKPGPKDKRARLALRGLGLGRVGAVRIHEADAHTKSLVRQAGEFVRATRTS